ncbi:DUF4129 domain-containing protein [Ornithinimicrobium sp. LYQ121]|uniref:DUF4129 domain-containing protein n=1 Tax=Ornithinimicrobium sp. LYQ121 TaxID=3378801 RepID=UPI0038529E02
MRSGTGSTVVTAVAAAAVLMVLLVWSAGNGTPLVSAPDVTWGASSPELSAATAEPQDLPTVEPPVEAEEPTELTNRTIDVAALLYGAALLAVVLLVLRWLLTRRLEDRHLRDDRDEEELLDLLEATSDEVRYRALTQGDPRNAVVACWVVLEEAVARSGLRQDRAETATELARRVLGRWDVEPGAVDTLAQAYREARFSRHPVTEGQRAEAVAALERIHADLRRRVKAEEDERAAERARAAEAGDAAEAGERAPAPRAEPVP